MYKFCEDPCLVILLVSDDDIKWKIIYVLGLLFASSKSTRLILILVSSLARQEVSFGIQLLIDCSVLQSTVHFYCRGWKTTIPICIEFSSIVEDGMLLFPCFTVVDEVFTH